MTDTLKDLERRKVELDRMMDNLRQTICNASFSLEGMKEQKRALIDEIARLKRNPMPPA